MRPGVVGIASLFVALASATLTSAALASPTLSQRVTQIDQALATNQQALASYTWQQQETITVNGSVKQQATYEVKPVPGGLPARTAAGRVVSRLSDQDQSYAEQIAGLAAQYAQPPPGKLVRLLNQGMVVINPTDQADVVHVDVQNYIKEGDDVTILFNNKTNQIVSIRVASYLTDPLNMVHMMAQYAVLPEGVSHLSTLTVDGLSNNMVISESNVNYQKSK